MSVATSLIAGNEPRPELAAEAVCHALERLGTRNAQGIVLLLTPEFARTSLQAVQAASRAGNSLQVSGCIVAGVANEVGWVVDRPAVAAMVFSSALPLASADSEQTDLLCFATGPVLPLPWRDAGRRCGLLVDDAIVKSGCAVWQNARPAADHRACVAVSGVTGHRAVATGLRALGPARRISAARDFDLLRLDDLPAADVLRRELPIDHRRDNGLPLQHLWAMVDVDCANELPEMLPIVSSNADASLTLGDRVATDRSLTFAIRQPLDAERDMRQRLNELTAACQQPAFGFFLSCIGRGPYFYGGDDRDWKLLCEAYPGMPFIGGYGSGQIASVPQPRALQHCVVVDVFA